MALIKPEDLPIPEEKLNILKMTTEKLTNAGYVFIGMDHFAKPTDELTIAQREKNCIEIFKDTALMPALTYTEWVLQALVKLENVTRKILKKKKNILTRLIMKYCPLSADII